MPELGPPSSNPPVSPSRMPTCSAALKEENHGLPLQPMVKPGVLPVRKGSPLSWTVVVFGDVDQRLIRRRRIADDGHVLGARGLVDGVKPVRACDVRDAIPVERLQYNA